VERTRTTRRRSTAYGLRWINSTSLALDPSISGLPSHCPLAARWPAADPDADGSRFASAAARRSAFDRSPKPLRNGCTRATLAAHAAVATPLPRSRSPSRRTNGRSVARDRSSGAEHALPPLC
jgi:hypothetical protein